MSRLSKTLMALGLILFVLACNFVTQPIRDAQNLAGTAQSLASAIPVDTLRALPSQIPVETLQAFPSTVPTLEALASALPDFGEYFNPQGAPVSEWNEIPIMPQATAGQEFNQNNMYSFKADVTAPEVQDFYHEKLAALGWTESFIFPGGSEGGVMVFQKEDSILTITITSVEDATVVLLTLT